MKISYSFGIVDLLHFGHINTLLQAKANSDIHIFGLVSDEAAISWMGTLVSNYNERKQVMENVSCIDEVIFQKSLDPLDNIKRIHSKYPRASITLFHGDNWKILVAEEYLEAIGGVVNFTQYYDKLKPENILKILNERSKPKAFISSLISTKASTLYSLKHRLKKSRIEEIFVTTVGEYRNNPSTIFSTIERIFDGSLVIIRSSSSKEDAIHMSNAGHYESVLNVSSSSKTDLQAAIETVINSYRKDGIIIDSEQILIQKQTQNVAFSGVVFTRDIHQNRPYYLVNYDDNGSTDSVTSGLGGKTLWIAHDCSKLEPIWEKLIDAIKELETLLGDMVLDIEFAIDESQHIVIFQVRPLAANYKFSKQQNDIDLFNLKSREKEKYNRLINVYDNSNLILSDMAFWNPSEIIGANPRNLDYSLYRELITSRAWNAGLVPMGYRVVTEELMYKIGNKPYISTDYSFLSLMPDQLDDKLASKLLKYYTAKLKKDLTAHDKIEFEIVLSCFDYNTKNELDELLNHDFSFEEIHCIGGSLLEMTDALFKGYFDVLERDLQDIEKLKNNLILIQTKQPFEETDLFTLLSYFKKIVSDIKTFGTPQFSRQARYAFISTSHCKSLVTQGYFSESQMDEFMLSIQTVASDFEREFNIYIAGGQSKQEFNRKYGHLRSGTYDIRTDRYDKIDFTTSSFKSNSNNFDKSQSSKGLDIALISKALCDIGLKVSPIEYVKVLKSSLEQREYFKYEFTKSLSLGIEILIQIGKLLHIDRDSLSYLELSEIFASKYYQTQRWTPKTGQWLRCRLRINMSPEGGHHDKAKKT